MEVDGDYGILKAKKAGNATITLTLYYEKGKSVKDTCDIAVAAAPGGGSTGGGTTPPPQPTAPYLNATLDNSNLYVGDTTRLNINTNIVGIVFWESNNKIIKSIGNMSIQAVGPGTTAIKVTAIANSGTETYVSIYVTVSEALEMTIYATDQGDSFSLIDGHSFIAITNRSSQPIDIAGFTLKGYETTTLGTFGNIKTTNTVEGHMGIWRNLEAIGASPSWQSCSSLSMSLSSSKIPIINDYINDENHNKWTPTTNCATFAVGLWNAVMNLQLSTGIPNTPHNLIAKIEQVAGHTSGDKTPVVPLNNYVGWYGDNQWHQIQDRSLIGYSS